MIMSLKYFVMISLSVGLLSCSAIPDMSEKKEEKKDEEKATPVTPDKNCEGDLCESPAKGESFTKLGLADHCAFGVAEGKGCFVCTPRELPIKMCTEVDEGFDPASACEFDLDLMTCKVKSDGDDFEFDFSEQTQMEKIYGKIPFLILGAKVLIGGKLKDKPEIKELVFSSFDSILKHKKALFTAGDTGPLLDEVAAHVKKAKPDLDEAKIKAVKDGMRKAIEVFVKGYAGMAGDGDFLTLAHGLISAIPPEILGNVLQELNIKDILASLQASGNSDIINEIITNQGGSTTEVIGGISGTESGSTATP